jgi:tetratricopeptide (TPR) repeat protein
MSPVVRFFIVLMGAVVLLAVLSLTFLNKHSPNMRMRALMREGRMATAEEAFDEAADAYRLAISIRPNNVKAYLLLAGALEEDGEYEDARYFLSVGMERTGSRKIREAYNDILGTINSMLDYDEEDWPE